MAEATPPRLTVLEPVAGQLKVVVRPYRLVSESLADIVARATVADPSASPAALKGRSQ